MDIDRYAKAIVGGVLAGLGTMYTALLDQVITAPEWVLIASSVVGNVVLIWAVPNAPMPVIKAPNGLPPRTDPV